MWWKWLITLGRISITKFLFRFFLIRYSITYCFLNCFQLTGSSTAFLIMKLSVYIDVSTYQIISFLPVWEPECTLTTKCCTFFSMPKGSLSLWSLTIDRELKQWSGKLVKGICFTKVRQYSDNFNLILQLLFQVFKDFTYNQDKNLYTIQIVSYITETIGDMIWITKSYILSVFLHKWAFGQK